MTADPDDDFYAEGADARLGGAAETDNPYDPDTQPVAFTKWSDGWESIDKDED
jgi:hypothetical protein